VGKASLHIENGAARISGDLTFPTVTSLYNSMQTVSKQDGIPGSINLSGVEQIDSAGLTLLLEWQDLFGKQTDPAGLIKIENPPQALLKIARLCDAEAYFSDHQPSTKEP
jgi:ABC-type transporter Mla MlaB component